MLAVCSFLLASGIMRPGPTTMIDLINEYQSDLRGLSRSYSVALSLKSQDRMAGYYADFRKKLDAVDFDRLDDSGKIDWILLSGKVTHDSRAVDIETKQIKESRELIPFSQTVIDLSEQTRGGTRIDGKKAAVTLGNLMKEVKAAKEKLAKAKAKRPVANRASRQCEALRGSLKAWNTFYTAYDPMFTWWTKTPYEETDKALADYSRFLKEQLAGIAPDDKWAIVGDPIGREALLEELKADYIPYTPEELIKIAEAEYKWCETEMKRAAKEMNLGDDWHAAVEKVKNDYVEPGEQPQMIREMAEEAIKFVEDNNLVTVPELCKETWRMEMMSAERQKVNPFFLGGEVIQVSFPTDSMTNDEKLMSLRANNRHFARATVQHELIPGHHLQGFMLNRYKTHRDMFGTPFWIEGWALYWEMLLWDKNFPQTPENRVGMLWWRMHRCARIVFSLSFHLEKMSPQECIDYLVEKVQHERSTAEGEVRRSLNGDYGPLYQLAYMIGGLQFRAMETEFVKSGKMSYRQFHDSTLRENQMPIAVLHSLLGKEKLTRKYEPNWRFYPGL